MNGYAVRNIKSMQGREGMAFSAILIKNGASVGVVRDNGNGGCLDFEMPYKDQQEFIAAAKEAFPDVQFEPESSLVNRLMLIADMNRKRNTVYLLTAQQVEEFWNEESENFTAHFTTSAPLTALKEQRPGALVWSKKAEDFVDVDTLV